MVKINWNSQIPAEAMEALQPIIQKWQWLVPPSTYAMDISFWAADKDENGKASVGQAAQMGTSDDYRCAHLEVFAIWLYEPPELREYSIIHELCHIYTALQANYFYNLLDELYPQGNEDAVYRLTKAANARLVEQATQDLVWVLLNQFPVKDD